MSKQTRPGDPAFLRAILSALAEQLPAPERAEAEAITNSSLSITRFRR